MSEKGKKERINKKNYKNVMLMFFAFVFIFTIIGHFAPDKSFSDVENRVLQDRPEISLNGIKTTEYMKNLESYVSDQFLGRNFWIRLKTKMELLAGKKELGNVYKAADNYLIQKPAIPNEKSEKKNIKAINSFASKYHNLKQNFLLVPNAAWVMKENLPFGAPIRDQQKDYNKIRDNIDINTISVFDTLKKHINEEMYYKTDHHWTSTGAFYAFLEAANSLGIEAKKSDFKKYMVARNFYGTLASNAGYYGKSDFVNVYKNKESNVQYIATNSDDDEKKTTVYDISKLKEKDKYQVFFGGNHGLVDIMTTHKSDKRLLVFKDSYANSFVPFLIPYYNEIVMVDPRYYYDDIDSLISNKSITDVLYIYNLDTFVEDSSLYNVLEG